MTSKFKLSKLVAVILIVTMVGSVLTAAAISFFGSQNNNPTPTLTPTPMPPPETTIPPTNPTTTPTPVTSTQEKVRDQVIQYIKTNHPETAQFITELVWSGGKAAPLLLVGSETYSYSSSGWNLTMTYPVVPNPIYKVVADYSAPHIGIPYRVIWEGTWQNETINENNYTFAQ